MLRFVILVVAPVVQSLQLIRLYSSVSVSIGEEEYKKGGAGFTSQLWKARVSIMKANNVLLNVSDSVYMYHPVPLFLFKLPPNLNDRFKS